MVIKAGFEATLVEAEVSGWDPAAGFTRRGQRSFFGYKARLAVDDHPSLQGLQPGGCNGPPT
ncbi:MAG TPA: hypothetical protein VHL31_16705 [Geminicoccus sp.]|uniref:hypothetical protein n=1 Tax=Geminicoccus sp. TaxID=2024832 RepID=UPI002E3782F0|nr:hypothetical protein [Geminicoccus sp.]HEX2527926.1 hypothetical protein [Geminicoccus sp.]